MNILIVGQYFWPESFRINEVANLLIGAGCKVDVLTGQPNYPDGAIPPGYSAVAVRIEQRGGVKIFRVPIVPRGQGTAIRLLLNYISFVVSACVLGPWLLRRKHFDVILVYAPGPILQSIPALLLGALKRAPVVTWVQDLWPESLETTGFVRNKHVLAMVAAVVRWIYRNNDLLLVQSRSFIQPVQAIAHNTPVVYHPNPGELPSPEAAAQCSPELRLNPGFNVVFAGNLGTVQALDTILEAAEKTTQHHDIWWVLVGSGSRSQWLAREITRRDLGQVMIPGRFPPEAMPRILAQASVLLVSLIRDPLMSRTVPSKVQAYLTTGRPMIACLDGEGARIVEEAGAGIVCPAENAAALAEAVLRLRAMPEDELRRMGEAGRQYYRQNFDPTLLVQRLLDHFRDIVGHKERFLRQPTSSRNK